MTSIFLNHDSIHKRNVGFQIVMKNGLSPKIISIKPQDN